MPSRPRQKKYKRFRSGKSEAGGGLEVGELLEGVGAEVVQRDVEIHLVVGGGGRGIVVVVVVVVVFSVLKRL
jgi:hypothetical protein